MAPLRKDPTQKSSLFSTPNSGSISPNNRYVDKKIVFLKKPNPKGSTAANVFDLPPMRDSLIIVDSGEITSGRNLDEDFRPRVR